MSNLLVIRNDKDGLATLTLNRPEKLNALTPQVFAELRRHIEATAQDTSIHCVVLAGSGRSFCAVNGGSSLLLALAICLLINVLFRNVERL